MINSSERPRRRVYRVLREALLFWMARKVESFLCFIALTLAALSTQDLHCLTPAQEEGLCVAPARCRFLIHLYQRYGVNVPHHYVDYLRRSQCPSGSDSGTGTGFRILLCCRIPDVMEYANIYVSGLDPSGLAILSGLKCGKSSANRIAFGNVTKLMELPWMALLRYETPGDIFKCGGSLITNRFVLTAAHCIRTGDPLMGVRLGEYELRNETDCEYGRKTICAPPVEDFGVEKVILHPQYSIYERMNDIALIRLDRDVEFKVHIRPICLPITQKAAHLAQMGEVVFEVAGWGYTEKGRTSDVLMKAEISRNDGTVCQTVYKSAVKVSEEHICARDNTGGMDTCRGDSGGPLFSLQPYKLAKRYVQYGIVSFGGISCKSTQALPGLYTNVSHFLSWITSNIVP